jgi:hypothetical protein
MALVASPIVENNAREECYCIFIIFALHLLDTFDLQGILSLENRIFLSLYKRGTQ